MSSEDDKLEQAFGDLLRSVQNVRRIELSDEEWMSIIARKRDGLPPCCGNISSLRDVMISLAREDGEIDFMYTTMLAQRITWCFPSHAVPSGAMQKVLDQLEYSHPDVERHEPDLHER